MADMTKELEEHKSLLIALIAGLVVAALGIMIVQGRAQQGGLPQGDGSNAPSAAQDGNDNTNTNAKNAALVRGILSISPLSGRQIYEPKETIVLAIKGDSDGHEAVGFDAALKIDRTVLAFSQATTQVPSFDIFNNVNDTRVYLGGIKKVDSKGSMVFANTPLAEVTFKALTQGYSPVTFIFNPQDTTESNIVLATSKDGLADVQGTDIYIGAKAQLTRKTSVILPGTDIEVQLKDLTVESATLDMEFGRQIDTKKFTWGADAAVSKNLETVFGYVFQLEKGQQGQSDGVTVYYAVQK